MLTSKGPGVAALWTAMVSKCVNILLIEKSSSH